MRGSADVRTSGRSFDLEYGSDVLADLLVKHNMEYVALNPGASFRGLHDSLVNHPDAPAMILCPHEKIAINIAHGYAKAKGEPMAAVVHNVVGLLHGSLGMFYAYLDRAPIMVLGGGGPIDAAKRRPQIDWIHTANVQGNAVREFTKWDDRPASIEAFPESLARGFQISRTEPAGPVYIELDAALQEAQLTTNAIPSYDIDRVAPPSRISPDPGVLDEAARALAAAEYPLIVAGYAGRDPSTFFLLQSLAEVLGAGVIDQGNRLNFPTRHHLNVTGTNAVESVDVVLLLDVKDPGRIFGETDPISRLTRSRVHKDAHIIRIGFGELQNASWVHHYGQLAEVNLDVLGDTSLALPLLLERCKELISSDSEAGADRRRRASEFFQDLHERQLTQWADAVTRANGSKNVAPAQLVSEIWSVIQDTDWVLTAGTANEWALRLWDFDQPYRHPGRSLGTATQIGISLGVALAHKGSQRLVVDIQPDGDLLYDTSALWTASAHNIPLLVVMFNNRAYYNDWNHQIQVAEARGRPVEKAHIGVAVSEPYPNFAQIAHGFGWHAEGPIGKTEEVATAVKRAADVVQRFGKPALVDVICEAR